MAFYFILTTSCFLNWTSDLDSDLIKSSRKLFDKLKLLSLTDNESKVMVVKETDKCLNEIFEKDDLWAYKFVRTYYDIAQEVDGNEIDAVTSLANSKSETFDKVIIINCSNCYENKKEIAGNDKIEVMNEIKALTFIIKNCFKQ